MQMFKLREDSSDQRNIFLQLEHNAKGVFSAGIWILLQVTLADNSGLYNDGPD